ncbi:hypothetical protein LSAT2_009940 [Lamellibrachia satsuma]|nr:hypothetical protein LSAT2_009940 [Lamellibrachia satsuma]
MYEGFTGHVIFNGQVSEGFQIGTGVRQGCLLSPLLFLIAVDWTMKRSTEHHRTGIQWNLFSQLEDLDFADDLALLSETHKHMQQKNRKASSSQLGLKINVGKTKVMKVNSRSSEPISLESGTVEEVQDFIYLRSNISTNGGADKDVELRINKARHAFRTLRPVWLSSQLSINTKIRIFNTNVKPVLLYGCETWEITQFLNNKLQVFINSRLRYILKVTIFFILSRTGLLKSVVSPGRRLSRAGNCFLALIRLSDVYNPFASDTDSEPDFKISSPKQSEELVDASVSFDDSLHKLPDLSVHSVQMSVTEGLIDTAANTSGSDDAGKKHPYTSCINIRFGKLQKTNICCGRQQPQ